MGLGQEHTLSSKSFCSQSISDPSVNLIGSESLWGRCVLWIGTWNTITQCTFVCCLARAGLTRVSLTRAGLRRGDLLRGARSVIALAGRWDLLRVIGPGIAWTGRWSWLRGGRPGLFSPECHIKSEYETGADIV